MNKAMGFYNILYSIQQTHTFEVFDEVTAHAQIMADFLGWENVKSHILHGFLFYAPLTDNTCFSSQIKKFFKQQFYLYQKKDHKVQ